MWPLRVPECGGGGRVEVGAQTCGVHCGGLASCAEAPHVEGTHVDRVALPGLQLHQGLAGGDAHNRPDKGAEPHHREPTHQASLSLFSYSPQRPSVIVDCISSRHGGVLGKGFNWLYPRLG